MICQLSASKNPWSGYSVGSSITILLADYATKAGQDTFAIRAYSEIRRVVEKQLRATDHTVVIYPEKTPTCTWRCTLLKHQSTS